MIGHFFKRLRYRRHSGYRYRIKQAGNQATFVGYLEQSVFGKNNLGKYRVMDQRRRRRWLKWALLAGSAAFLYWAFAVYL